jgi:hypothetical protein
MNAFFLYCMDLEEPRLKHDSKKESTFTCSAAVPEPQGAALILLLEPKPHQNVYIFEFFKI